MSSTTTHAPQSDLTANASLECPAGRWWLCALLGLVLIAGGVFVLADVVLASIVAAIFFAAALIVGGLLQIIHAFSARGWGSLVLSLIVGLMYVGAGVLLMADPLATSLALTIVIAAFLLVSGAVRLWLGFRQWRDYGWLLGLSGLIGIALGIVLFLGFPWSGLVVPGMLLGIDLIFHGAWWLTLGLVVRRPVPGLRSFAAT